MSSTGSTDGIGSSVVNWLTSTESKLTSGIQKDPGSAEQRFVEYTSIKGILQWDQLALLVQTVRTDWGFAPLLPGSGGLYIASACIVIGGIVLSSVIIGLLLSIFNFFKLGFTGGLRTKKSVIVFILSRSKVDVSMGGFPGCFEEDVKVY